MMKIYLVRGSHPHVPGNPLRPCASPADAAARARSLVNAIREEEIEHLVEGGPPLILPRLAGEFDWREALREWQRASIAAQGHDGAGLMNDDELAEASGASVSIDELEMATPAVPDALQEIFDTVQAATKFLYESGAEDQAAAADALGLAMQQLRWAAITARPASADDSIIASVGSLMFESPPCRPWSAREPAVPPEPAVPQVSGCEDAITGGDLGQGSREQSFAGDDLKTFTVTVDYQTEGGDPSSWRGFIRARDEDEAQRWGEARARAARPRLMKIIGGSVERKVGE